MSAFKCEKSNCKFSGVCREKSFFSECKREDCVVNESRLGGSTHKVREGWKVADRPFVYTFDTVDQAAAEFYHGLRHYHYCKRLNKNPPYYHGMVHQLRSGTDGLPTIIDESNRLIDEVLLVDPRLVKRAAWVLDTEGIDLAPELVAAGEERCCVNRRKLKVADQSTSEPVRVVISTDSRHVDRTHAVAFIAAAKLAQQFRPLEIWWQSAWLDDDANGPIALTKLVSGDMDFSRLEFVLSSGHRDEAGHYVIAGCVQRDKILWRGAPGKYSYLPDTFDFVSEAGIKSDSGTVAAMAAKWAGFDNIWSQYISPWSAEQFWRPEQKDKSSGPTITAEDRARWKRQEQDEKANRSLAAKERLTSLDT